MKIGTSASIKPVNIQSNSATAQQCKSSIASSILSFIQAMGRPSVIQEVCASTNAASIVIQVDHHRRH
jgi:hypothetical protein